MIDKDVSKKHANSEKFSSINCNDLLKNILIYFVSSAPAASGW